MDNNDFLTLHCLTLKQLCDTDSVEAIVGVPAAAAEAALGWLVGEGLVKEAKPGAAGGQSQRRFVILPTGRDRLDALYPEVFADVRSAGRLGSTYERFEEVNRDLKSLITEWQTILIDGKAVPNDHSDEAYDRKVIDRLNDFHDGVEPMFGDLAAGVGRLSRYGDRLGTALDKVDTGETDYVSGVRVDSYHTVWFELHEDLIRILGTTRDE
jgi:hypothetical protein